MNENEISYLIQKAIFSAYNRLGPGLFESVYQRALIVELRKLLLIVQEQVPIPFIYEGEKIEAGFRVDILVNKCVVIEVKSIEELAEIHHKQLLTYLKLGGYRLGILVNFNSSNIAKSIFRKVLGDIALKNP
jgi:GxxExxY protein